MQRNRFTIVFLVSAAVLFLLPFSSSTAETPSMEEMFWARDWKGLDAAVSSRPKSLSPREMSLAANAFWLQGRWDDALKFLGEASSFWPPEVAPYGTMMTILGLERTNRRDEAAVLARNFLPKAPADIAYYVAYALCRLTGEDEKKPLLLRMYSLAETKEQRSAALLALLGLPGDKTSYALNLLGMHPGNGTALKALESLPKPWKNEVNFAVGYGAYLQGKYAKAVPLLKAVPLNSRNGRKARYYRAFSLYSQKKYGEALELWSTLAKEGTSFAESSVRRISILAGRAERERALRVLREVAASRDGDVRVRACYSLSTHLEGEEKRGMEDRVIALAPGSRFTADILWERGWARWKREDFRGALREWEKGLSGGMDGNWRPRVLYWMAAGHGRLGEEKDRKSLLEVLNKEHPLSVYAFLAGTGKIPLLEGIPEGFRMKGQSLLEEWGFVIYARKKLLSGGEPSSLYRAARLSLWMDDSAQAYSAAGKLAGEIFRGPSFHREAMEILYPRPFRAEVESAAKRFNVDERLIWAVMRQESAFDMNATSWVGAAGLMQLMPSTARGEAKALELKKYSLYSPGTNILLGASHLARLLQSFGAEEQAVAAYNAGGGAARRWLGGRGQIPLDEWIEAVRYEETNTYVQRVMANLHVYRALYPRERAGEGKRAPLVSGDLPEDGASSPGGEEKDSGEEEDASPLLFDQGGK